MSGLGEREPAVRGTGEERPARHRAHGEPKSRSHQPPVSQMAPGQASLPEVRPARRIWLQERGMRLFGPGAQELLRGVEDTGSLSRAAKDMGMSYSKAWRMVDEIERGLDTRLLERQTGGLTGGGSRLTAEGSLVLERFEAFIRDADDMLEALFYKHFADLPYGAASGSEADPARLPR